jgi:hypothetical protein
MVGGGDQFLAGYRLMVSRVKRHHGGKIGRQKNRLRFFRLSLDLLFPSQSV